MFDKNTLRTMNMDFFKKALTFRPRIEDLRDPAKDSGIEVVVRKRPIFEKEKEGDYDVVSFTEKAVRVTKCQYQADLKVPFFLHCTYHLDRVFGEHSTNEQVYDGAAKNIVDTAIKGGFGTIFMLGQTGSGKTHTMTALEEFAAEAIFAADIKQVAITFVEIRDYKVYDLFAVKVLEKKKKYDDNPITLEEAHYENVVKYQMPVVHQHDCNSSEDLIHFMNLGHMARHTECTEANDVSSRSHAMCILDIKGGGKLLLVDCAGTERKKDNMFHSKQRQQEGSFINASLHTLKETIRLRSELEKGKSIPRHHFRSGPLVKILAESFTAKK